MTATAFLIDISVIRWLLRKANTGQIHFFRMNGLSQNEKNISMENNPLVVG